MNAFISIEMKNLVDSNEVFFMIIVCAEEFVGFFISLIKKSFVNNN